MATACDCNDRKGCTEQPCDDASRYTDGDLRLALVEITKDVRAAEIRAKLFRMCGFKRNAEHWECEAQGLHKASVIFVETIKQEAAKREARRLTSMPSV